jgi:hypothetical protein
MYYTFPVTIPPNTPIASYIRSECRMQAGTVRDIYISIPYGVCALAGVRISNYGRQLIPEVSNTWITGDQPLPPITSEIILSDYPYALLVDCYNTDDTYQHTITVDFNLELKTDQITRTTTSNLSKLYQALKGG